MVDAMDHVEAVEQLFAVQAVTHGQLAAEAPKDPHVRRATDALLRAAYPKLPTPAAVERRRRRLARGLPADDPADVM